MPESQYRLKVAVVSDQALDHQQELRLLTLQGFGHWPERK